MIRCVIFDMDGTLADTMPLCIEAFRQSIQQLAQVVLGDKEIVSTFGPSEEGTIAALLPGRIQEGMQTYLEKYKQLHPAMCPQPFEGIMPLLDELSQRRVQLAIVTGKGAAALDISLVQLGLIQYFSVTETGSPEGPCKPQKIQDVLRKLALQPEDAIYVGDMVSDITAAREAGLETIAAAWAGTAPQEALEAQNPAVVCTTPEEMLEYLLPRLPN